MHRPEIAGDGRGGRPLTENEAGPAIDPCAPSRWDLFCRVIDNLGDAGVCWRLARALGAGPATAVRLYIDDPAPLAALAASDPPAAAGVTVHRWNPDTDLAAELAGARHADAPARPIDPDWCQVSVAAFACRRPEPYLEAIARRDDRPVLINLEYLSAEPWVEAAHGGASPHPRLPLTEHFFFPGFTERTGGLLREPDLIRRRNAWREDPQARIGLARELGLPRVDADEQWISLFCYARAPLAGWLDLLADSTERIRLLVPEGAPRTALATAGLPALETGRTFARGALEITGIPFLAQDRYDALLWSCALNVVRGEDSFVRAQWAGVPMLWHAYRQDDDAHLAKVRAFVQRYLEGFPPALHVSVEALFTGLNDGSGCARRWAEAWSALPAWRGHADRWAALLAARPDLASRLASFCADRIKC